MSVQNFLKIAIEIAENVLMNKKTDPNTKHYFQITTASDLSQILHQKIDNKKEILLQLWEKGQEEKDSETYEIYGFDFVTKVLKLKPIGKFLSTITGSVKTGKQILLKIPIDDKTNYFTGGLLQFHKENLSYSVQIQQDIFISQQRSNFRLNANNVIQIQFKMNNIVYDALDLSIGGTSFKISTINDEQLKKNEIFKECILRFDRKNYLIPEAKISSISPIIDEDGKKTDFIKIGIAFLNLNQKIAEELNVKISVEARGEEMKLKFDAIFAKPIS